MMFQILSKIRSIKSVLRRISRTQPIVALALLILGWLISEFFSFNELMQNLRFKVKEGFGGKNKYGGRNCKVTLYSDEKNESRDGCKYRQSFGEKCKWKPNEKQCVRGGNGRALYSASSTSLIKDLFPSKETGQA